jgi:hypothetical protein
MQFILFKGSRKMAIVNSSTERVVLIRRYGNAATAGLAAHARPGLNSCPGASQDGEFARQLLGFNCSAVFQNAGRLNDRRS